jgi:hypothetical protein
LHPQFAAYEFVVRWARVINVLFLFSLSLAQTPLPQCVDGNRIVRITNGVFAAFKKLKILSTSQQQGTLFRLRFTLKKYA